MDVDVASGVVATMLVASVMDGWAASLELITVTKELGVMVGTAEGALSVSVTWPATDDDSVGTALLMEKEVVPEI